MQSNLLVGQVILRCDLPQSALLCIVQ